MEEESLKTPDVNIQFLFPVDGDKRITAENRTELPSQYRENENSNVPDDEPSTNNTPRPQTELPKKDYPK